MPDAVDACPDRPGAPDLNPKKNGCPSLAKVERGQIVILQQVNFATAKDVILPSSRPVLEAVARILEASKEIRHLSIQGHTDSIGKPEANRNLSENRAKSVKAWLVKHGIAADRLESHGFGQTRPIAVNLTDRGRAANRRVEFHILEQAAADP